MSRPARVSFIGSRRGPRSRAPGRLWLAVLLACLAQTARADLELIWVDHFSPAEQATLSAWLQETFAGVEDLVGELPMGVRAYLHRRDGAGEPVPWAHTERDGRQGVHFYVDPGYRLEAFRQDWTAPHELSHLILPYVGGRNAWFAEGFASYMQYQVMEAIGVLGPAGAAERYRRHLTQAAAGYDYPDLSFVAAAPKLLARRKYPVMYWGGAAYFLRVDRALAGSGSSLPAVLRDYVRCCRDNRDSLDALLTVLDRLARSSVFTRAYTRLSEEPGFPQVQGLVSD